MGRTSVKSETDQSMVLKRLGRVCCGYHLFTCTSRYHRYHNALPRLQLICRIPTTASNLDPSNSIGTEMDPVSRSPEFPWNRGNSKDGVPAQTGPVL